jgi:hypothetical protein
MSKKKTSNNMNRMPVYSTNNRRTFRKYVLGKKEKRIISHTTLHYGESKTVIQAKGKNFKVKTNEYKRKYYSTFIKLKQDKLEALSRNQLHLIALTGTIIGYSVLNIIAIKQKSMRRFFLVSKSNVDPSNSLFFGFKAENIEAVLDYISLLNNFDESSIINYFDSYIKQKGGIKLNPINTTDMTIFDLPDDLIEAIDFNAVPTVDLEKSQPMKTNEVFLFNQENKSICFGRVSNGSQLHISSNTVCGGLVYSLWDLKHPIGINTDCNSYLKFTADKFKQIINTSQVKDTYMLSM